MDYAEQRKQERDEAAQAASAGYREKCLQVGDLHFLFIDRTDSSWIFHVAHKTGPHTFHCRGTATIHFPCHGFHKARISVSTHTDDPVPEDREFLKKFFTELLQKLKIPDGAPWHASWHHAEGGIGIESEKNPGVFD